MAVTGKQVFDMACTLIDEVSEMGTIVLDNPKYYETRAKTILSILQTELIPPSETPQIISDLNQDLLVVDRVAITTLPYGLAAHLIMTEDVNTASFFNNRYEELKRKVPTAIVPIIDVNNVLGGMS